MSHHCAIVSSLVSGKTGEGAHVFIILWFTTHHEQQLDFPILLLLNDSIGWNLDFCLPKQSIPLQIINYSIFFNIKAETDCNRIAIFIFMIHKCSNENSYEGLVYSTQNSIKGLRDICCLHLFIYNHNLLIAILYIYNRNLF